MFINPNAEVHWSDLIGNVFYLFSRYIFQLKLQLFVLYVDRKYRNSIDSIEILFDHVKVNTAF